MTSYHTHKKKHTKRIKVMKSKQTTSSRCKLLVEDCGVISTWFQELWDALAEMFELPEVLDKQQEY